MTSVRRPTTPLRRISRGSISALSQSRGSGSATPLTFLEGAMADLADETSVLQSNLEQVETIHEALGTFNESFAMYLYGLKMNAFCVEWPEAPAEENFARAEEREARLREQQARQQQFSYAQYAPQLGAGSNVGDQTSIFGDDVGQAGGVGGFGPGDQTYVTQDEQSTMFETPPKAALKPALKKPATKAPAGKGKMTVATKKKMEALASQIIETLPLEYRGNDAKPRQIAEGVIMALISAGRKGARTNEIVKMPDLPQAKVNKTLIALVAAKHVVKTSNNGIIYQLDPARHPELP